MKVWSTRAWQKRGIEELEGRETEYVNYVSVNSGGAWLRWGVDAHHSRANALAIAEKRRVAKVASLKRQIARLEALRFEGVNDA